MLAGREVRGGGGFEKHGLSSSKGLRVCPSLIPSHTDTMEMLCTRLQYVYTVCLSLVGKHTAQVQRRGGLK